MRRLAHHLFTLAAILSLLLALTASVLWATAQRSAGGQRRLLSRYVPPLGARYTLRLEDGRFVLYRPPPSRAATIQAGTARTQEYRGRWADLMNKPAAWLPGPTALPPELAAAMRNEDLVWEVWRDRAVWRSGDAPKFRLHFSPRGRLGSPTNQLAPRGPAVEDVEEGYFPSQEFPRWRQPPYTLPEVAPALLEALEDEDRWVAAHVVLGWVGQPRRLTGVAPPFTEGADWFAPEQPGGTGGAKPRASRGLFSVFRSSEPEPEPVPDRFAASIDGLRVDLRAVGEEVLFEETIGADFPLRGHGWIRKCAAVVDTAQRAEVLDRWHWWLDVPIAGAAAWQVVAAGFVLPAALAGRSVFVLARCRRRLRSRLCPSCGYDLRASPERCPECGAARAG